jgi:type II secretory pathway pseudopilin PulG
MVELVIAFFLLGILSLTAIALLSPNQAKGGDDAAKASLVIAAERQVTAVLTGGSLIPASEMSAVGSVAFITSASTEPTEVSISISGDVMGAAAFADTKSCWLLRRDLSSSSTTPVLWAVGEVDMCSGATALALEIPANGGSTPDSPIQL